VGRLPARRPVHEDSIRKLDGFQRVTLETDVEETWLLEVLHVGCTPEAEYGLRRAWELLDLDPSFRSVLPAEI